jgi:hypothetical protein
MHHHGCRVPPEDSPLAGSPRGHSHTITTRAERYVSLLPRELILEIQRANPPEVGAVQNSLVFVRRTRDLLADGPTLPEAVRGGHLL